MRCDLNIVIVSVLLVQLSRSDPICHSEYCTADNSTLISRVLSRRKRFLIFPDGASFQLVFCLQTSAIITIGDIFLYANTAALAWTLPTDPKLFHILKGAKILRRGDTKEIYYLDEDGKVVDKVPYKKLKIIPTIAKRSVDDNTTFKEKLKQKLEQQRQDEKQHNIKYLKRVYVNEKHVEFHRSSRVGLYEKVEKLLQALGGDGRQCLLYKLCEASRLPLRRGTFLHELLAIVFTLPKGKEFDKEEHREYDRAHSPTDDNCDELYPGCV